MNTKYIAQQVRKFRQQRGWTQDQLGNAAKMTGAYISRVERGVRECRPTTIARIAAALCVPIDVLTTPVEERAVPTHSIPMALHMAAVENGFSFAATHWLASLQLKRQPTTAAEWRRIYNALNEYL